MRQVYEDILLRLKTLGCFKTIKIFNNQVDRMVMGNLNYESPACFVEIINERTTNIGQRLSGIDLVIKFHIVLVELNSQVAGFDQTITAFKLRNQVTKNFTMFFPTRCGAMAPYGDLQDYRHGNVYQYVRQFRTHWIDNSAFSEEVLLPHYVVWDGVDADVMQWDEVLAYWQSFVLPSLYLDENSVTI